MSRQVRILSGVRTAMTEYESGRTGDGRPGGAFKDTSAVELGAHAARAALARAKVDPGAIDHVVFGNAVQSSTDLIYGARHVGLKAGVPLDVPALTVNRLCGSGIQAIISGAQLIQLGEATRVLAGGMENMSQCPHVIRGARSGFRLGQGRLEDLLMAALLDPYCGLQMAETAERLARSYGLTREEQDAYALRSQTEAARAQKDGLLAEEIEPLELKQGRREVTVDRDDHLRPETTPEILAKLPTVFSRDGFVTAGNASGIVDGGAAVVLADADADGNGRDHLGTVRGWATVGVDPSEMGIGPAPAIRGLLERQGLGLDEIDLFEINEAFAGQYLAVERELGLDRERVNVNGGAIALGHPLGATGTRLTITLLLEMRRRGSRLGIASGCIGGGQGIALLVEAA
jgi:acetyl-CoA acetyltransferase family protein